MTLMIVELPSSPFYTLLQQMSQSLPSLVAQSRLDPPLLLSREALSRYLGMRTAVVDDDICNGLQVVLMDHGDAIPELRLRAVLAVQVVQVPGEVALVADGIAGGWHPHAREARLCYGLRLTLQHLRPHSLTMRAAGTSEALARCMLK